MGEPDASVAIVYTGDDVLLMRRAEREGDSWSGHWSFPGGRREPGDRDPLDTALRELQEECGIQIGREALERELPLRVARRNTPPYLQVAPFVLRVDRMFETVLDPMEAAWAKWMPLRVLRNPASHRLRAIPGRPANLLFPSVDTESYPLWGFTYGLINSWLGLEPDRREAAEAAVEAVSRFLASQPAVPVESVVEHFSAPENFLAGINRMEVNSDEIRIAALGWEE